MRLSRGFSHPHFPPSIMELPREAQGRHLEKLGLGECEGSDRPLLMRLVTRKGNR